MPHFEPSHRKRASDAQLNYLRQLGVICETNISQRDASELIEDKKRDRDQLPATDKQKWRLQQANLWREGMTRSKASELIAKLVNNVSPMTHPDEDCSDASAALPYVRRRREGNG